MSRDIRTTAIHPDPDQPRVEFQDNRLADLAQSMDENGQAVSVAIRPDPDRSGQYILIHGERRWRAARRLGWDTIKADVQDIPLEEARWLSLIENVQREALSPVEEARAYRRQLQKHDLTQAGLGEKIGKSQSYVAQKLRLLRMPEPLSFFLERHLLTEGHARQLLKMKRRYLKGSRISIEPLAEDPPFEDIAMVPNLLRPLDGIPIFPPEDKDDQEVWTDAAHRLFAYAREHGPEVDAWIVGAWVLGLTASVQDMSVADLSRAVGNVTDLLSDHLGYFFIHPPLISEARDAPNVRFEGMPPDAGRRVRELATWEASATVESMHHWGALSDLRHAGMLKALRATWRATDPEEAAELDPSGGSDEPDLTPKQLEQNQDMWWEASGNVCKNGYSWPSSMQGGGPNYRFRKELEDHLQQLRALEE